MDDARPSDLDLLRRFEPIVRFCEGELFLPAAVDEYVPCCGLWSRGPNRPELIAGPRELDIERLVEEGTRRPGPGLWLRLVSEPAGRLEVSRWRHRADRPRFHGGRRLAQVGVASRIVDVANRMTLMMRGRVATGAQAAAEETYRNHTTPWRHPYYGRVLRQSGYVVLQYWFFYFFNDWRSRVYGVNDHEADWEQVTIYAVADPDDEGGAVRPAWVAYSAHDEVGDDLRRRWDDPDLTLVGEHPVVYAGLGSHSGAYLPGDYLVTFDPPALKGAIRLGRRVTQALLPWSKDAKHAIGIPYVDYHRGDGVAVGPGEANAWQPAIVDDDTPWVRDYQGLWGDDTEDPFGGERGPAGPRYERSAVVRLSWADPVAWAGLDKVSPTEAVRQEVVKARVVALDSELHALHVDADEARAVLRAKTGAGGNVTREEDLELVAQTARRTELEDERKALVESLDQPPAAAGPHEHLRRRHLPLEPDTRGHARLLTASAAISTPVVLAVIALLVLPFGPSLVATVLLGLLVVMIIEATARGHLLRFLGMSFLALMAVSFAASIVVGLVNNWRYTSAIVLGVGALLVLIVNLVELTRD